MQRKRILVIDDSETIRLLVRLVLRPYYDVLTAADGPSGIDRFLADGPDLIVLDLMMPDMDGLKVCEILRGHDTTSRTPIVVLTSIVEGQKLRVDQQQWWDAYVLKPIDRAGLLATVRRCLNEPDTDSCVGAGLPGSASSRKR